MIFMALLVLSVGELRISCCAANRIANLMPVKTEYRPNLPFLMLGTPNFPGMPSLGRRNCKSGEIEANLPVGICVPPSYLCAYDA